jgi:ABC-type transport system involved in multi-copper enzyme maturation permease subunit
MTANTLQRPEQSTSPVRRPSLGRLTVVEMRKMIDTRAGYWLLSAIALLSVAVVVIMLIWGGGDGTEGDPDTRNLAGFFEASLIPVALLLPVLGILTVTSEWSQRTALATFTLVPERQRVMIAKLAAASAFAALSVLTSLLVSAVGNALGLLLTSADGSWSLSASTVLQALLMQLLNVVMGVAFGMLLMNTPAAIVLYFVLPTALTILASVIDSISKALEWLDLNQTMQPLSTGDISGDDWGKLATSSLLWIVIPLALGAIRLLRREVK